MLLYVLIGNIRIMPKLFHLTVDKNSLLDFFKIFDYFICIEDGKDYSYDKVKVITMKQNIIDSLKNFLNKYSNDNRNNQLIKEFKKVKDGENFILYLHISLNGKIEDAEFNKIENDMILELNKLLGLSCEEMIKYISFINNNYDLQSSKKYEYDGKHTYEIDSKGKQCKYCPNLGMEYFHKDAHIIPESLGGHLLDARECDECNDYFGRIIEPNLLKFLGPFRTILGISGKSGIPKSKDSNNTTIEFKIDSNKNKINEINIIPDKDSAIKDLENNKLKYKIEKINFHSLYKCLSKIALGLIPQKDIHNFSKTINWIKDEKNSCNLPPLIFNFHYMNIHNRPCIDIYKRKDVNNYDIPYMFAVLSLKGMNFIYIVPLSNYDKKDFFDKDDFDKIMNNLFYKFAYSKKYILINCNENKEVSFEYEFDLNTPNMNIKINGLIPIF